MATVRLDISAFLCTCGVTILCNPRYSRGCGASAGSMSESAGGLTPRTPGTTADESFFVESAIVTMPARLQFEGALDEQTKHGEEEDIDRS